MSYKTGGRIPPCEDASDMARGATRGFRASRKLPGFPKGRGPFPRVLCCRIFDEMKEMMIRGPGEVARRRITPGDPSALEIRACWPRRASRPHVPQRIDPCFIGHGGSINEQFVDPKSPPAAGSAGERRSGRSREDWPRAKTTQSRFRRNFCEIEHIAEL